MGNQAFNKYYILRISFVSALGGYLFGFDFAVISGALPFLRTAFQLTPVWEGFLTGSLAIGCIVGCLLAGNLADRHGRKPSLMIAAIIFAVSSLGMALSPTLNVFLIMRFVAGIGVGMASMLSPMYIAEISPADTRGRNVAINQLTIVVGILITNIINYSLSANGANVWRWMFGLGFVPSALFLVGLIWLPESPRWLIKANKSQKAKIVLNKIGNPGFAENAFDNIQSSMTDHPVKQSYAAVFAKSVRPAVMVGVVLAVFQQLCGINVVFNYTSTIFKSLGATLNEQLFETIFIGIVNLIFTIVAMWQVDKIGRRTLMLFGSGSLAFLYVLLAILLKNNVALIWVSLVVLTAISTYAVSLAPVTWVLISEIFPNTIRGLASSVAIVSLWSAYFLLVFTFPFLVEKLGAYGPFWMYSIICLAGFLFIKIKVKETKGKTLEELEEIFITH
ncbi:MAG TPA: sugar porter family MFS transporter [Puia sp.]|nr:sugar porter family MFS transporter [Puia sp.]